MGRRENEKHLSWRRARERTSRPCRSSGHDVKCSRNPRFHRLRSRSYPRTGGGTRAGFPPCSGNTTIYVDCQDPQWRQWDGARRYTVRGSGSELLTTGNFEEVLTVVEQRSKANV